MEAIKATGNRLVVALDKNDSAGVLDRYFPETSFFTEFERFDRHIEKLRRTNGEERVDYVSICSPNYLHDAHIRFGLRVQADVICEKPLVLEPWNLDALASIEKEFGKKISTILQLRLHPAVLALKEKVESQPGKVFDIDLTYVTPRGKWFLVSWKSDPHKSGGIAMNIGVHFFDMLLWIFGGVKKNIVHCHDTLRAAGLLELERARVRWFLSVDRNDLPGEKAVKNAPFRCLAIDGREYDFSEGFADLHMKSYKMILDGKGFGVDDSRPSINLVHDIRYAKPVGLQGDYHPLLKLK